MYAHSDARCQCSSRMPPAVSRMLTPEISSEMAKSACVTWRAQPPFWMRRGELLNDAQFCCRPPTSVAGGDTADGNWPAIAGFCGPGSTKLRGFWALIAPCGGRSGLPKVCAFTLAAAPASKPPAADAASRARRENDTISLPPALRDDGRMFAEPARHDFFDIAALARYCRNRQEPRPRRPR